RFAQPAMPLLLRATKDDDPQVQINAALTLVYLPAQIGGTLEPAMQLVRAGGDSVPIDIIEAVSKIGRRAAPAAPVLIRLLCHADEKVQREAGYALEHIGPVVVPALVAALHGADASLRAAAAKALGEYYPHCPPAVAALAEALRDSDVLVGRQAASALANYDAQAAPALPALIEAFQSPEEELCGSAAFALNHLGHLARPALPVLIKSLKAPEADRRSSAVFVLAGLGPHARAGL